MGTFYEEAVLRAAVKAAAKDPEVAARLTAFRAAPPSIFNYEKAILFGKLELETLRYLDMSTEDVQQPLIVRVVNFIKRIWRRLTARYY